MTRMPVVLMTTTRAEVPMTITKAEVQMTGKVRMMAEDDI